MNLYQIDDLDDLTETFHNYNLMKLNEYLKIK